MQSPGEICSLIASIPSTSVSTVWTIISYTLSTYWYVIIPFLIGWVIIEMGTRYKHEFSSENGFTPVFNSFIGGGVYYLSNVIILLILNLLFGLVTNCATLLVTSFYLVPFVTTALFLHWIGFWPYMRDPFTRKKIRIFKSSRHF